MIREVALNFASKWRLSEAILALSFFPTERLEQVALEQNMTMKRWLPP